MDMDSVRKSFHEGRSFGPRLDRVNANKSIAYDSSGSMNRRGRRSDADEESEGSNHSVDNWTGEQEFIVHGKGDLAEMNTVFRFLGLPPAAQMGIQTEVWESVKHTPSVSPVDGFGDRRRIGSSKDLGFGSFLDYAERPSPSPKPTNSRISNFNSARDAAAAGQQPTRSSPVRSPPFQQAGDSRTRVETASPSESQATVSWPPERPPDNNDHRAGKTVPNLSNIVKQVLEKKQRDEAEAAAAAVSSFIESHRVEDQLTLCVPHIETAPLLSIPSLATSPATVGVERSLSEPIPESALRPKEALLLYENSLGGGSFKEPNVDRKSEFVGLANEAVSTSSRPEPVSRTSHCPTGRKDAGTSLEQTRSNSPSRILKPPPPMKTMKIPLQQMSTVEMLGSLAPDTNMPAWTSSSDDEDESSETDDAEGSKTGLQVEPEQQKPNHVSSNGGIAHNEVERRENPRAPASAVRGSVPEQLEFLNDVGKNPEIEIPEVAPVPQENPLGPKFPWTKGGVLGAGSFGTVYAAIDRDGMWFAVKEVSMVEQDKQAQQCIAQLMQEIELLSQFKHDNIVQYLGTEKAHGKLYIFLELASRGSLAGVYKMVQLGDSQISRYTREILKGLKFLHDRSIVHRDIKCANILVDNQGICKLADFGMAKQISSLDQMKSCKGSAYWMAPEVIDPKKAYGPPADIWSLGCSILEMATRAPPFGDMEWYQVLWKVGHGTAPPIPDSLSDAAKDFVMLCLEVNPIKRPTATQLLEHKFVWQAGGLTPTYSTSTNMPPVLPNLQTISEEHSADMSSSQAAGSLSNGN